MARRPGKCLLYSILKERNITPREYADISGMNLQQISAYHTGVRTMSLATAATIAGDFGIPIDDLYEWIEE